MIKKSILSLVLFALPVVRAFPQEAGKNAIGEVKGIISEIAALKQFDCKYSILAEFPSGEKDKLIGEAYTSASGKLLYNNSNAMTILYNGDWCYKADHNTKTLVLVNVKKRFTAQEKQTMEKQLFDNGLLKGFIDSVITKYAVVKEFKRKGDTVSFSLGFPAKLAIKDMKVVYNSRSKLPASVYLKYYLPWTGPNESFRKKGTSKEILYNAYTASIDPKKISTAAYFSILDGKVTIKKNENYKLISKL